MTIDEIETGTWQRAADLARALFQGPGCNNPEAYLYYRRSTDPRAWATLRFSDATPGEDWTLASPVNWARAGLWSADNAKYRLHDLLRKLPILPDVG